MTDDIRKKAEEEANDILYRGLPTKYGAKIFLLKDQDIPKQSIKNVIQSIADHIEPLSRRNKELEAKNQELEQELAIAIKTKDMYLKATDSEKDKKIQKLEQELSSARQEAKDNKRAYFVQKNKVEKFQSLLEKAMDYASHDQNCLWSQFRMGRPTEDGGYETLCGYGKNEKWYQKGEEPVCNCGLRQLEKELEEEK